MVQVPLQHSSGVVHMSPSWTQYEEALQMPLKHSPEQHVFPGPHALPSVLHPVLSGTHVPPVQLWPQQDALEVQAWPSEMHTRGWQVPIMAPIVIRQFPLQHSVELMHAAPRFRQPPSKLTPELLLLPVLVLVPVPVLLLVPPSVPPELVVPVLVPVPVPVLVPEPVIMPPMPPVLAPVLDPVFMPPVPVVPLDWVPPPEAVPLELVPVKVG
jgi:hypothetical protein